MDPFRVWTQPSANACLVRVDGIRNARWLLDRLGRSFIFKTSEPIHHDLSSSSYTFHVMYSSQMSRRSLKKSLQAIPQVKLIEDPR